MPKTVPFDIDPQYSRLFADDVVEAINRLKLPRYGLGNYVVATADVPPTVEEEKLLDDLSRAGRRLMGFCRTNLFKRLESSGHAFILSIERHVVRNYIFLHALENGEPLPIGAVDAAMLDTYSFDEDTDGVVGNIFEDDDETVSLDNTNEELQAQSAEANFRKRAEEIYRVFAGPFNTRFRWLSSHHFDSSLRDDLVEDVEVLSGMLSKFGDWNSAQDAKLDSLYSTFRKRTLK